MKKPWNFQRLDRYAAAVILAHLDLLAGVCRADADLYHFENTPPPPSYLIANTLREAEASLDRLVRQIEKEAKNNAWGDKIDALFGHGAAIVRAQSSLEADQEKKFQHACDAFDAAYMALQNVQPPLPKDIQDKLLEAAILLRSEPKAQWVSEAAVARGKAEGAPMGR